MKKVIFISIGLILVYWITNSILWSMASDTKSFIDCLLPTDINIILSGILLISLVIAGLIIASVLSNKAKRECIDYKYILDNMNVGAGIADKEKNILYVNNEFCNITKFDKNELIHSNINKLLDEKTRKELIEKHNKSTSFSDEISLITKNNDKVPVSVSLSNIIDEKKENRGIFAIVNDISKQKETERKLENEHKQLLFIMDNIDEIIYIVNPKTYELIYTNQAFNREFGEHIGGKCYDVIKDGMSLCSHCPNENDINLKNPEGYYSWEYFNKKFKKWYRCINKAIRWFDGRIVRYEMAIEITETKLIEKALRENEEKYRLLFSNMLNGFVYNKIILDEKGKPVDYEIIEINKTFENIIGVAKDTLIGKKITEVLPEIVNDEFDWIGTYGKVALEGKNIRFERYFEPLKQWFTIYVYSPKKYYFAVLFDDITEKKELEIKLKKHSERLDLILDATKDGVWDYDLETGEVYLSPRYCLMLGYTKDEFTKTGDKWLNIFHPDDKEKVLKDMDNFIKNDKNDIELEYRMKRKSGDYIWILTKARISERDKNGKTLRIVGANTDITERKVWEEQLKELNQELEERVSERTKQLQTTNDELESFSYSVSHDLRSPLRAMDGFSQALLEDYYDVIDEEGKNYLMRIRRGSQRMGQLIDDLLKLSRVTRSELNYEKVNLSKIVEEIKNDLYNMGTEHHVEFIIEPNVFVRGDEMLLKVLLNNLISNAWKFTKKKSNPRIEFGKNDLNGKIVYFVKDNGAGFDMKYADKMFMAFQRLHNKKEFEGTGIGLATVERVIKKHNGKIWAEGKVGEGAQFYFILN